MHLILSSLPSVSSFLNFPDSTISTIFSAMLDPTPLWSEGSKKKREKKRERKKKERKERREERKPERNKERKKKEKKERVRKKSEGSFNTADIRDEELSFEIN